MKALQFIEIGTLANDSDFEGDVETLLHVPINDETTMKEVYDDLVDQLTGDEYSILALEKFIAAQDKDSFDQNIFKAEKIKLEAGDINQYYMIFHLFNVKNMLETEDGE